MQSERFVSGWFNEYVCFSLAKKIEPFLECNTVQTDQWFGFGLFSNQLHFSCLHITHSLCFNNSLVKLKQIHSHTSPRRHQSDFIFAPWSCILHLILQFSYAVKFTFEPIKSVMPEVRVLLHCVVQIDYDFD